MIMNADQVKDLSHASSILVWYAGELASQGRVSSDRFSPAAGYAAKMFTQEIYTIQCMLQ